MRRVEGWGSKSARLVIFAEAPGEREENVGQPLVGPSGFRLNEWMARAGLSRADAYIDNLYQYRPPGNQIKVIDQLTLEQWMGYAHERIAELDDPWVIVPTGNYALYALTGKGKVHWHLRDGHETRPGILDWRGSILEYTDLRGRTIKCIPTIHPAATFRQPSLERACVVDWERIASELQFRELRRPVRHHHIYPSLSQLAALHQSACEPGALLSIDIENPRREKSITVYEEDGVTEQRYKSGKKKGRIKTKKEKGDPAIVCVGFAITPTESVTVPTTLSHWKSESKLQEAWQWIHHLCTSPAEKVLHNGLYDTFFLADHGIRLTNWKWDTLYMHHCLDASAPHDLAYCASVDTREPYWKSEAKDPDEIGKYTSNWAAFLTYNGKDCCVTRELADIYKSRLTSLSLPHERGMDFYLRHYPPLFGALLDLERHGIRVDTHKRKYRLLELMANCIDLQDQLTALSGMQLYGTTSLSTAKLKKYLYEQLALPKQWRKRKDTGEKTETVDEVAVRRLMERHPTCQPLQTTGPLILSHRRQQTLLHFYKTERVDEDGRYRSSYSPNTEAGRLSSSKNPRGTGSNAQNVDREARDIFLADAGMVGIEVDGSQVEARVDYLLIYMLTGDRAILDKARLRPDEYDQHTENAAAIFHKPATSITKEERYLGKKAVHAAFRDMQGQKLADELLKEGRIYSADQCDKLIKAFRTRLGVGYIEELFRWVRGRIIKDRYLENSWGRRLWFEYDRLDDEAYRRGYSFDPQSECADWMNQRGLIPLHAYLQQEGIGAINAHVHDSLFFSVIPERAYEATQFLVSSLEQPRTIWGVELSIPCEIKIGGRWKGEHEWKRMPTQQEFEAAVQGLPLIPA